MIGRVIAYTLAGIPAAIGIWFIADYAFATSDDGYSAAFQLGLIAATAYAAPALALAVAGNGRKIAAVLLGFLALGAIVANWSQTLDALANRGAGKEAETVKLSATVKSDRARLERVERERASLPNVSATDEAVKAAQAAVFAAERAQRAECDKRGRLCREREGEEAAKRDALSKVLADKAIADKAAKLDREIADLSSRLAKAPPVKESSAGKTLGSLLSLSAVSAATFQQQFFSAIVELAIAAALALPELLRPRHQPAAKREEKPGATYVAPEEETAPTVSEPVTPRLMSDQNVVKVLSGIVLPADRRRRVEIADVFTAYMSACKKQGVEAAGVEEFGAQAKAFTEAADIRILASGGRVYWCGVQLANAGSARLKAKTST
jgi:hypothetical protein